MADLFGFGVQKPAPKALGEDELKRDREISPLVRLMEQSGQQQAAALTKANISPQEKSVIAKLLMQQGGGGGQANQLEALSDTLSNAKSSEELERNYAQASVRLASSGANPSSINEQQKALKTSRDQKKRVFDDKKVEEGVRDRFERALNAIDNAEKAIGSGNLRKHIFTSDDPYIRELEGLSTYFAGLENLAEGGRHTVGVSQMKKNLENIVGQINKGTGVDPNTFIASLKGAMEAGGFGKIADEVLSERAAGQGNNMDASSNTIAPTSRTLPSMGKYLKDSGFDTLGNAFGAVEGLMNFTSNITNALTFPLRAPVNALFGTNIGGYTVEDTNESAFVENGLMLAGLALTGYSLAPALGAPAGAGIAARALGAGRIGGAIGAPIAAGAAGSYAAGRSYDAIAGKPETKSQANRKNAFEELGGGLGFGMAANAIRGIYQRKANRVAGGSTPPRQPSGTNPKPSGGATSKEPFDVDITPKSPVANKLDTVAKHAASSGVIAQTIRKADGKIPTELRGQLVDDSMLNATMAYRAISSLGKSVKGSDIAGFRLDTAQDLAQSLQNKSELALTKENEYQQAVRTVEAMDPMDPQREAAVEAMRMAELSATSHWAGLNNAVEASSGIANSLVGSATASPDNSIASEAMQKSLTDAINSQSRVPDYYPLTSRVINEAQQSPVAIPRSNDPKKMFRDNQAEAQWRMEVTDAQQRSDDRARAEIRAEDKRAYDADRTMKERGNERAIADNTANVNGLIDFSLGQHESIRNDTDLANKLYQDLNRMYKSEVAPLNKRYEAIDRQLSRMFVPEEAIQAIKDGALNIIEEIEQSKVLSAESTKARQLLDKIAEGNFDNLNQVQKTIREVHKIAQYESPEGSPKNILRIPTKPLEDGMERALEILAENERSIKGKRGRKNSVEATKRELDAVNAEYRALKDRLANPAIERLRSHKADSATAALNSLTANPEEFGRLASALGQDNPDLRALLARKLKQELEPALRTGDKPRMDAIVDQWDSESMPSLPLGLADTIKGMQLHEPVAIAPYRARDVSSVRSNPKEWFKMPPSSVKLQDMTDEQVWGMLDSMEGLDRFLANTPDTQARKDLLTEKAVSILNTGNAKKSRMAFAIRKLEHHGFDVSENDPLSMASRWEDILEGGDEAKKALVRKMLGEEGYKDTKKWVSEAAKDANAVVKNREVWKYTLASAKSITSWHAGIVSGAIGIYRAALAHKAKSRLRAKGIDTKKKKE